MAESCQRIDGGQNICNHPVGGVEIIPANELLSTFNPQKVKYLVVGAYAVSKFGAPLEGLTAEGFIVRDKFFRMGRTPVMVDILPKISGVDFDRAWQSRVDAVIDPESSDAPRSRSLPVAAFTPSSRPAPALSRPLLCSAAVTTT